MANNWYPTRMYTLEEEADWLAPSLAELPPDASEAEREQCRIDVFVVAREMRLPFRIRITSSGI